MSLCCYDKKIRITIFDVNFILTIVGFVSFTTFFPFVNSVSIRAICLFVSLICLIKSGIRLKTISTSANVYMILLFFMVVRTTIDIFLGSLSNAPVSGKAIVLLFTYGVMLIPLISIISSYSKVNWNACFLIIHLLLFAAIFQGILNSSVSEVLATSNGRVGMNERQGTLQFATNSSYLLLVSLVLLTKSSFKRKWKVYVHKIFCIAGVLLSFVGFFKAGSRGAFLASLIVVFFFIYNVSNNYKRWFVCVGSLLVLAFGAIMSFFMEFAPVLYSRILLAIEEGDEQRKEMYIKGVGKFYDSPILGDNPLIVWDGGFCGHHNMYLDVALFLGFLGFVIFIGIYFSHFWKVLLHRTKRQDALFFNMLFVLFFFRGFSGLCIVNDPLISLSFVLGRLFFLQRIRKSS